MGALFSFQSQKIPQGIFWWTLGCRSTRGARSSERTYIATRPAGRTYRPLGKKILLKIFLSMGHKALTGLSFLWFLALAYALTLVESGPRAAAIGFFSGPILGRPPAQNLFFQSAAHSRASQFLLLKTERKPGCFPPSHEPQKIHAFKSCPIYFAHFEDSKRQNQNQKTPLLFGAF